MVQKAKRNAVEWDGWLPLAQKRLLEAGGELPWYELRDALVSHYSATVALTKGNCDDVWLGCCALASLPSKYLSEKDSLIRLPIDEPSRKKPKLADSVGPDNSQKSQECFKVHVAGLPFAMNEDAIKNVFSKCGEIVQCDLLRTHEGKSRGIAFVSFASASVLERALELSDSELDGRLIKVSRAVGVGRRDTEGKGKGKGKEKGKGKDGKDGKGKTKSAKDNKDSGVQVKSVESREFEVFVGGLPFALPEEVIRKDFGACGDTGRFHIPLDGEGNHTGLAFINYLTKEAMEKALEFNDQEYGGVYIRVQKADAPRGAGVGK